MPKAGTVLFAGITNSCSNDDSEQSTQKDKQTNAHLQQLILNMREKRIQHIKVLMVIQPHLEIQITIHWDL